jgi:hypothetical protein
MVTTVEGFRKRGISLVAKGHECSGAERFKGYRRSLWACARACERSSDMIVYGTNEFGVNRCKGKGCACYCEDATKAKCYKRVSHKGYNLFDITGKTPVLVEKGHECNDWEKNMGYRKTLGACFKVCREWSTMLVYGTNEFGMTRCSKGKGCACYCERAATKVCKKRVAHKGFNLYLFTD